MWKIFMCKYGACFLCILLVLPPTSIHHINMLIRQMAPVVEDEVEEKLDYVAGSTDYMDLFELDSQA